MADGSGSQCANAASGPKSFSQTLSRSDTWALTFPDRRGALAFDSALNSGQPKTPFPKDTEGHKTDPTEILFKRS